LIPTPHLGRGFVGATKWRGAVGSHARMTRTQVLLNVQPLLVLKETNAVYLIKWLGSNLTEGSIVE